MKLDYVKIINEKCGVMYGGNQSDFGKNIRRSGCGMIAACDVLLYKQGKRVLTDSEYKQFVTEKSKDFFYRHHINLTGITASRIVKFLRKHGYSFCFIPKRKLRGNLFEQRIEETLGKDTPVIVRVGLNGKKLHYEVTHSVNSRVSKGIMFWHYITVTGFENGILTYSTWGATGKMQLSELQKHLGFMGGIIVPD